MSHTSTLKGITINNVAAIAAAVAHLKSQGINVELAENTKPRAYYSNQEGMTEPADLTLHLPTTKYDVGLYLQPDGTYAVRFDEYAGYVASVLGDAEVMKSDRTGGAICKFTSEYAVQVALQTAYSRGLSAQRSVNERGDTVLVMTGV